MAKRWTAEEDSLLLKLRQEGLSAREMTLHLDRKYGAIRMRLTTINAAPISRSWTEQDKTLAWKLKEDGHANKYIAKKLNRTTAAIATFFVRDERAHYSFSNAGKNSS